jgi:hypothetical protein
MIYNTPGKKEGKPALERHPTVVFRDLVLVSY